MPIWVFHGGSDTVVSPDESIKLVDELNECGGRVEFTLYPDAGHVDSWVNAYGDSALYDWLLSHSLGATTAVDPKSKLATTWATIKQSK